MRTATSSRARVFDACGTPLDSDYFDVVGRVELDLDQMLAGDERVLARFRLPDRYCGVLSHFAQLTDRLESDGEFSTPGIRWTLRSNGRPLAPYQDVPMVINPWEHGGYGVHIRLDENATIELAVRRVDPLPPPARQIRSVAGRIQGQYWYNPAYGDAALL